MKITRKQVRMLILNEMKKTRVFDIYPKVYRSAHGGILGEPGEEKMGRLRVDEPLTGPDIHSSLSPYGLQTVGKIAPVFDEDGDEEVDWPELEALIAHLIASKEKKEDDEDPGVDLRGIKVTPQSIARLKDRMRRTTGHISGPRTKDVPVGMWDPRTGKVRTK